MASIQVFKTALQAARAIAERVGGKLIENEYSPTVCIGEDASIRVKLTGDYATSQLRATVYRGKGGYDQDIGWKSIKAKEIRGESNGFCKPIEKYEADIDALVVKLQPMLDSLKGYAAKDEARRTAEADAAKANREYRRPYADSLVSSSLASYRDNRAQERSDISSHPDRKFSIEARDTEIRVSFGMPYGKAEKVLQFLRAELE